jgi:hypothetical protein
MGTPVLQATKCCCRCWYRIPLCPCEPDDETWPLYIPCDLVDAFFAAHPELNNHLVFDRFDPNAEDFKLCYELLPLDIWKVPEVPSVPPPIILDQIPPEDTWYPPPFDDCAFCCPNPCCPPCWGQPDADACCWLPGEIAHAKATVSEIITTWLCCSPSGGQEVCTCPGIVYEADYELVSCDTGGAVWAKMIGEEDCLWDWWGFVCYHEPPTGDLGWENSEDMDCEQFCSCEGFCLDFLPFCCPKEGEEPGQPVGGFFPYCNELLPIDFTNCLSVAWGWECLYASIIDCPGWGGGDPDELCTCAWQTLLFEFDTIEECFFYPLDSGAWPSGICFPDAP